MTTLSPDRAAPVAPGQVREARERLDAWVREVVAWHFGPQTGSPFWLDYARRLDWDPRTEIHALDDLRRFEPFQDEWLRGGPVSRWVPMAYKGKPVHVFETGGSTGVPRSRIDIEDFRIDYSMFSATLNDAAFPPGSDWLALGPTGPRRLRLAGEHLAQVRRGICFLLDLDPRWVVKCLKRGAVDSAQAYTVHVIDQALTIIRAHPNIRCLITTPRLLEALCQKISLHHAGITGVFCCGTQMTPEFHRLAREELCVGAEFVPAYGNTLMGLACHKPFVPEDQYSIIYHPPLPRAVLEVVDPDRPERVVGYGQRGRIKLTTLTREFFMPGFLERDEATRTPPIGLYPWDGVGDVKPFSRLNAHVLEGVH